MSKTYRKTGFIAAIIVIGLLLSGYNLQTSHLIEESSGKPTQVDGKITDQAAADSCLKTLEKNLTAATSKDINIYVSTLVKEAQEPTRKEMEEFFSQYDLEQTLLSFEVVKQEKTSMLVAAEQKTINRGKNSFRNHITQAHHTFVLEDGAWKIKETIMTNTEFLE